MSHFLAPENSVFAVALGLLLLIGGLQLVTFLLGVTVFSFLDDLLPDSGVTPDLTGAEVSTGVLDSVLGLLGIGKVPAIVSMLLFLFLFSFIGYNFQLFLSIASIGPLSALPASGIALTLTLPVLRLANDVAARILPGDESQAVSEETFVGKIARVTLGTVTEERASEAKLEDEHGRVHYVQVIAAEAGEVFRTGDTVIIVRRDGGRFAVVRGIGLLEE